MFLSIFIAVIVGVSVSSIVIVFILPKLQKQTADQLITLNNQRIESEKNEIRSDLNNKKELIESLVKRIHEELEKQEDKLNKAEKERIGTFNQLVQQLKTQQELSRELNITTEGLKKVLSNNQLRGQFGEQVAENLLKMSGFVRGVDYKVNKKQGFHTSRPDFAVYLPNKVVVNVDAKFPYSNLQKMTETSSKLAKTEYLKLFKQDVKNKIDQVLTRDYINPEENTVDFVIVFIPNEMIFSFIYEKMNDIWHKAMENKVVLAGPFSFTAILRMARQAHTNFHYQKNIQKIITQIKLFEEEFEQYNQEFETLGKRIKSLSDQYDKVNGTRTKQLLKKIDKVKLYSPDVVKEVSKKSGHP